MDCLNTEALLNRLADGELGEPEQAEAERHLEQCASCRKQLELLRKESLLLSDHFSTQEEPAIDFRQLSDRVRRSRLRLVWFHPALAVAASMLLVIGISFLFRSPGAAKHETLWQVSGALETRAPGGAWSRVTGEVVVGERHQLRAADGIAVLSLACGSRLTLREGTKLTVRSLAKGLRGGLQVESGEVFAQITAAESDFCLHTSIGDVVAAQAELDLRVHHVEENTAATGQSLLDSLASSLIRSAYAADEEPATPQMVLTVLVGSARLENRHGQVVVPAGQQAAIVGDAAPGDPAAADVGLVTAWRRPPVLVSRGVAAPDVGAAATRPPEDTPEVAEPGPAVAKRPPGAHGPKLAPVVPQGIPEPPVKLDAIAVLDGLELHWQDNPLNRDRRVWYDVYRRAPGDEDYTRINQAPVRAEQDKAEYLDVAVDPDVTYKYAVVTVAHDEPGKFVESELGGEVRARALDFRIGFLGGNTELATVQVAKLVHGVWVKERFHVRQRDVETRNAGAIGEPRKCTFTLLDDYERTEVIDFTTRYALIEVVRAKWDVVNGHAQDGDLKPYTDVLKIIVAGPHGDRHEIWQIKAKQVPQEDEED